MLSLFFFAGQLFGQQDVGVSTLIGPISGCQVGTANTPINVIVQNYSPFPIAPGSITVRYSVNGGPITSQLVTTFLLGNASYNFTFSQTRNFTACSQWSIKIWTSFPADANNSNDTLTTLFTNDCFPVPGTFAGPSLLCDGANNDSIQIIGGSFNYGLEWFSQVLPGSFNTTGVTTDKYYLNNLTDATNYQVVYDGGFCPNVTSPVYTVDISPALQLGSTSPDLNFCATNVLGSVELNGFMSQLDDWEQSLDGVNWTSTGSNANPYSISAYTDTTYFRALVSSGACGTGYSDTIAVLIEPEVVPGTIAGSTTVCAGANSGTLNLTGFANAAAYEWYISTDNVNFTPTGVTTTSYNYTNLTQTTFFKVILTCNLCPAEETPVISVSVDPTVNLGTNSTGLNLCASNITGEVSVSGFTTSITEWIYSTDGGLTWLNTGSNTNPYNISSITSSTDFRAIIESGACGVDTTASIPVLIEQPIVAGTIAGSTSVCEGSNSGVLTLSGNANEVSFEWYSSTDNVNFTATGITTNTFNYTNLTATHYFKVVLFGNLCNDEETTVATVNVDPLLNTGIASPDLLLCADNVTGNIGLTGVISSITNWEQSIDGGATWTSTGSNANPYSINGIISNTLYRANIESGACGTSYSDTIAVQIEPTLIPGTISGATTVCASGNSGVLTLTGNANDFGYEWYVSSDNITYTATGVTTATFSYTNLTQTTYFKVVLLGNACSNSETAVQMISVDPVVNTGLASAGLLLCEDNVIGDVSLTGVVSTISYWEQSTDNGVTWTSTGSTANPYSINGLGVSSFFRAVVESGSCGTAISDTIAVLIEPVVIPGTIAGGTNVCEGTNSGNLTLTGNANDSGYEWYLSTDNLTFSPTGITSNIYSYNNLTQTTYYKVVLQGNSCSDVETSVVAVTVDPSLDLGSTSPDLLLCATNVAGSVSLTGAVSLFDWEQSNDNGFTWISTSSTANPYDISGLTSSALFRGLISSGACGSGYSNVITVEIEPSVIPGNITGATTVCATANSGTLNLVGNAFDFGYEWYSSTDNITFAPTGVTSSSYNYTNLATTTYFKVILAGNSCADTETSVVVVQVDPPLNIGSPSADLTLCASNVAGSVGLTGVVSLMDWEQSTDNGVTWVSMLSAANPYNISSITTSSLFRALVSSGTCGSAYSSSIAVTIEPEIVIGTVTNDTTVCANVNSGTLTLTGNSNDFGVEWYSSTDNVNFTSTGNTTNVLNYSNLGQTTYYKVVLWGNTCSDQETPVVTVFVDAPLNLGTVSSDLVLCESNITGTVSVIGAVSLVDWEQSNDNGITWTSTFDNSSSHDISTLTSNALFRALIASGACGSGYSDTISVEIQPEILPGNITGATTVCAGTNTGTLTLVGNANDFGYEWYTSTDNSTFTASAVTTATYSYTNLTQTLYAKVILTGDACSNQETAVVTVNVDPVLNLGIVSPDLFLCENDITGSVQINGAVSLVDWEQSNDNGATWITTNDNSVSHDISTLTASALFRAVIASGVCGSGYSDTVAVTIEPLIVPGTISGTTNVCAGTNTGSLTLTGNQHDFGYEWFISNDNVNFSATGISTPSYTFNNLTQTTYFKVVLAGNACNDAETSVVTVLVDPPLNLGIPSADLILCENNITGSVSLLGAVTIMNWELSYNNGSNWLSLASNNSSYDISGITNSALYRAIISSGACGTGISDTISVTIDELGVPASIGNNFTACFGAADTNTIQVNNHTGSISEWLTSSDGVTWVNTGNNDSTFLITSLLQNTSYQLSTSHGACPNVVSNIITGTLDTPPSANAGPDQTVQLGSSIQLSGSGGLFGIWTPPTFLLDPTSASPLCTPTESIAYAYTVINVNGCTHTDYVVITVDSNDVEKEEEKEGIQVYNILTLNGDGKNDVFVIEGLEIYENNKVNVFNGNGNLVFSASDYQSDWDGSYNGVLLPDGVYLYTIEESRITKHRGFLTIIKSE